MEKPTRYYIAYLDAQRYQQVLAQVGGNPDDVDPVDLWTTEDAATLRAAKRLAKRRSLERGVTVTVYERVGFIESHPARESEAPVETTWEWDYVSVGGSIEGRWEEY